MGHVHARTSLSNFIIVLPSFKHLLDIGVGWSQLKLPKPGNGAIFLRWFRLYMLSVMFRFMFANICFNKNKNSKIHVMFIINIT